MEFYLEVGDEEGANAASKAGFHGVVSTGPRGKVTLLKTNDLEKVGSDFLLTEDESLAKEAKRKGLKVALLVQSPVKPKVEVDLLVVPYGLVNPRSVRQLGVDRVLAYNVNDPVIAERMKEIGVKGVVTSNVNLIKEMEKVNQGSP
ncbi:hypothetical protein HS1genome_1565 [Sulfodiicoccus acidiphilus]|uniref:GP-PDE domain-containing protein n=1 Tax=Sulfodiicoccus acidiphilus TaxID=1670455 RepID=A0A348B4S4_9CREN|nr:hypothetical protein [Sulfodiicoccus acidiphilus]BBD73176.1 hypothetical protein HS1genome_1565 [Sulfodiicoccus acidiphilus]GGU01318.1 hypothetical protein GCM10007116_18110 [Sulfodiicoccus acidiphilus]